MTQKDHSRFRPYNVKAITGSFKKTINKCDIDHLTKDAYKFATLYFGFIAHYNHNGFMETYRNDMNSYIEQIANANVDRYHRDQWFANEYGTAYVNSIFDIGKEVIEYAKQHKDKIAVIMYQRNRENAAATVEQLKKKYDL